jgi:hypothetical protein
MPHNMQTLYRFGMKNNFFTPKRPCRFSFQNRTCQAVLQDCAFFAQTFLKASRKITFLHQLPHFQPMPNIQLYTASHLIR